MHSSGLRGSDFRLQWRGSEISHGEFFRDFKATTRLGLVAPRRTEGAGAVTFAMASVTAFYDRYRERGGDFFAYPDFYTFQRTNPVASYGFFDFWPDKDVLVGEDRNAAAAALIDRAVHVLLVPDRLGADWTCEPVHLEGLRRNVRRCFTYGAAGHVENADLAITCDLEPLSSYVGRMFTSIDVQAPPRNSEQAGVLRQSFREIELADALSRL